MFYEFVRDIFFFFGALDTFVKVESLEKLSYKNLLQKVLLCLPDLLMAVIFSVIVAKHIVRHDIYFYEILLRSSDQVFFWGKITYNEINLSLSMCCSLNFSCSMTLFSFG